MPDTETEMNPTETETTGQDIQSELMDMIIADESPSAISDKIKDMLFAKSAEKVDAYRPEVAAGTFGDTQAATAAVADGAAAIGGETAAAADTSAEE